MIRLQIMKVTTRWCIIISHSLINRLVRAISVVIFKLIFVFIAFTFSFLFFFFVLLLLLCTLKLALPFKHLSLFLCQTFCINLTAYMRKFIKCSLYSGWITFMILVRYNKIITCPIKIEQKFKHIEAVNHSRFKIINRTEKSCVF